MPIPLDIFNLVIDKKAVIQKYKGGLEQFRIDYNIPASRINQEDDELLSLGQMNADQYDLEALVEKGLDYDGKRSDDFTVLYRYGKPSWIVPWINFNGLFVWHTDISPEVEEKLNKIRKMKLKDIADEMDKGNNLLKTIRRDNL